MILIVWLIDECMIGVDCLKLRIELMMRFARNI